MGKRDFIFTRESLRQVDRRAVVEFGIPIVALMENAGRAVADAAMRMKSGSHVLIIAGPGNNGGDGLVAARHLHNAGMKVTILLAAPRDAFREAAAAQLATADAMKLTVETATEGHAELRDWLVDSLPDDLIIDAIFGTGLSRKVEGLPAELIAAVNNSGRPILSVDIPSGMDCDSGAPAGGGSAETIIRATETVSFCGLKKGFARGKKFTGKVDVADISVPVELLRELTA